MDADTLVALVLLAIIFGASGLYGLSKLYFWAMGVNTSSEPARVMSRALAPAPAPARPFPLEREPEPEPEPAEPAPPALPAPAGKLYTDEQIAALTTQAEERGAARALGLLLGRGLVGADERTAAMELVFGARGRRWQRVRPLIEVAAAEATPPAQPARVVPIDGGKQGYVEL